MACASLTASRMAASKFCVMPSVSVVMVQDCSPYASVSDQLAIFSRACASKKSYASCGDAP